MLPRTCTQGSQSVTEKKMLIMNQGSQCTTAQLTIFLQIIFLFAKLNRMQPAFYNTNLTSLLGPNFLLDVMRGVPS